MKRQKFSKWQAQRKTEEKHKHIKHYFNLISTTLFDDFGHHIQKSSSLTTANHISYHLNTSFSSITLSRLRLQSYTQTSVERSATSWVCISFKQTCWRDQDSFNSNSKCIFLIQMILWSVSMSVPVHITLRCCKFS